MREAQEGEGEQGEVHTNMHTSQEQMEGLASCIAPQNAAKGENV